MQAFSIRTTIRRRRKEEKREKKTLLTIFIYFNFSKNMQRERFRNIQKMAGAVLNSVKLGKTS